MCISHTKTMSKTLMRQKAIELRLEGKSFGQIKTVLNVSKSSLSIWLKNYPLSEKQLKALIKPNPIRYEKMRKTKALKKQKRLDEVYEKMSVKISKLSDRELFVVGLFLYWGEGTKSSESILAFTNTDPDMVKFFVKWLNLFGIDNKKMKARLHLYTDMNVEKETLFWSKYLNIKIDNFNKPQIKKSKLSDITYKHGFGHGTCSVSYGNIHLYEQVMMGLKYIRQKLAS